METAGRSRKMKRKQMEVNDVEESLCRCFSISKRASGGVGAGAPPRT